MFLNGGRLNVWKRSIVPKSLYYLNFFEYASFFSNLIELSENSHGKSKHKNQAAVNNDAW